MGIPRLRLHPLYKLILSAFIVALSFTSLSLTRLSLLALIFLVLILADFQCRTGGRLLLSLLPCTFMALLAFIFGNSPQEILIMVLRVEIMMFSGIFMLSTSSAELLRGLSSVGIPDFLLLGFLIVFRFLYVLQDELMSIREAGYMLKRGSLSPFKKFYRCIIVPFVYRLMSLSDQIALSVDSRDFGVGKRSIYRERKISIWDNIAAVAVVLGSVLAVWMPSV